MEVASAKLVNRDEITGAALSTFAGDSTDIPESYIRTDEVLAAEVVGEDEAYELPVVDMAKLLDPDSSAMETEKLGHACRHWGFFQVHLESCYYFSPSHLDVVHAVIWPA